MSELNRSNRTSERANRITSGGSPHQPSPRPTCPFLQPNLGAPAEPTSRASAVSLLAGRGHRSSTTWVLFYVDYLLLDGAALHFGFSSTAESTQRATHRSPEYSSPLVFPPPSGGQPGTPRSHQRSRAPSRLPHVLMYVLSLVTRSKQASTPHTFFLWQLPLRRPENQTKTKKKQRKNKNKI